MRFVAISAVCMLLTTVLVSTASSQATMDWATHVFEYVQPDASGDATSGSGAASWADITKLSASTLADGTIALKLEFGATTGATGQVMYNIDWKVGDEATLYQTGMIVTWAGGQVVHSARGGWSGATTVGTPTFSASGKYLAAIVTPETIGDPAPGTTISAIRARTGAMVSGAPAGQTGAGSSSAHDTLTPSVDPKEFTYGASLASTTESLIAAATGENATADAGGNASLAFAITNNGTEAASVNLTITNTTAPPTANATLSAANATIEANSTFNATLEISLPADLQPGDYSWEILAMGAKGGNATLTLRLTVQAPAIVSSNVTAASNATSEAAGPKETKADGGIPAPGFAVTALTLVALGLMRRRRT